MNQNEQDILKSIFSRLPDEQLPHDFQSEIMHIVRKVTVGINRRNELLRGLALIAGTLFMIGITVAAFTFMGIPQIIIDFPPVSIPPSYIYFGLLVLVLLFSDQILRQIYYKKRAG